MRVSSEFSKHASHYETYNIIQNKVVKRLLEKMSKKPLHILDLGCGSGALSKSIEWHYESFIGVDFAEGMLAMHPKSEKIECIHGDFNDTKLFSELQSHKIDYIFSASALQWAVDLDKVFENIAQMQKDFSLAIFTSGTFQTLNKTAGLTPLLRSAQEVAELANKHFNAELELVTYKLEFESVREMFRYIKRSGVSASRRVLDYKQTKKLMKEYPLNYLEFEVMFLISR